MLDTFYEVINPSIALLILITNFIEIVLLLRDKKALTTSMIYILNLAIADSLVGLLVLVITVMYHYRLLASHAIYFTLLLNLSMHMSSMNLIAIAADRCLSVTKPIWHRVKQRTFSITVCIALWVVAAAVLTTFYVLIKFFTNGSHLKWRLLFLTHPLVTFTTTVVLAYGYYTIVNEMRMRRRRIMFQKCLDKMPVQHTLSCEKKKLAEEAKMIRLIVPIVILYVLCWVPISVYYIFEVFNEYNERVLKPLFCISLLNSLLNPLLYFHHIRVPLFKVLSMGFMANEEHGAIVKCCIKNGWK